MAPTFICYSHDRRSAGSTLFLKRTGYSSGASQNLLIPRRGRQDAMPGNLFGRAQF